MKDVVDPRERDGPGNASALLDTTFHLLASHRRRTVLRIMVERDEPSIPFSDLTTEIIEREDGDCAIDHDTVVIDLHHNHLPKLDDSGVIDYDRQSNVVRYHGDDEIEGLLREDGLRKPNRDNPVYS